MHGSWCWKPVAELLDSAGHRVFTPTLTGQGERANELTRKTGVADHLDDVSSVIVNSQLTEVIVVLHSYSGILAGPLAQRHSGAIRTIVGAGAFLANDGENLMEVEPPEVGAAYQGLVRHGGEGWRVPVRKSFMDKWGIEDPELRAYVGARLTDFPAKCLTDRVSFDQIYLDSLTRHYIEHTSPPLDSLNFSRERAQANTWKMHTIASGHDFMLSDPQGTAEILNWISRQNQPAVLPS